MKMAIFFIILQSYGINFHQNRFFLLEITLRKLNNCNFLVKSPEAFLDSLHLNHTNLKPMKANIGIPENHLQEVANKLNKVLANETVLYTKTRNYHWNIEGGNFMELHKFFEGQYQALEEVIDNVAERIRALGHFAEARLKDYLKLADLEEPEYSSNQKEQLQNLLNDHETMIRLFRNLITELGEVHKDLGSADFVTRLMETHEKMAWMIRSYLK